jgi:hypothetical protein
VTAFLWPGLVDAEPRLTDLADAVLAIPMGCTWCVVYDWEGGDQRGRGITRRMRELVGWDRLMPGERRPREGRAPVLAEEVTHEAVGRLGRVEEWLRSLPAHEATRERCLRSPVAYEAAYEYLLALRDARTIPNDMACPRCRPRAA